MSKRVVVIASGETERQALPVLLGHLEAEGISDAQAIACRSPSFKGLLDAVRNGGRLA